MSTRNYCLNCQRPVTTCLCDALVQLDCDYRVVILQDPNEARHALSSAPILQKSIRSAQLFVGDIFDPEAILDENWRSNSLLVFPSEQAIPAHQVCTQAVKNIILLDGTWRKVTRMLHSNTWLQQLPCLGISALHASQYKIRKSPRADGLSTIEAAVCVLNELHDDRDFSPILKAFERMIDIQIDAMGEAVFCKNYSTTTNR